jgi:hypothetical protein
MAPVKLKSESCLALLAFRLAALITFLSLTCTQVPIWRVKEKDVRRHAVYVIRVVMQSGYHWTVERR